MAGQNLQAKHSDARAEADYEINQNRNLRSKQYFSMLENQNELIMKILKHVDAKT